MKKATRLLLLLSMLAALLCVSAMAAETRTPTAGGGGGGGSSTTEPTCAGLYGFDTDDGVTIEALTASGESITPQMYDCYCDFCANGEKLSVSYDDAVEGKFYLLLVLNTDTAAPTVDDIVYIDQQTATASGVSFTAYPSALGKGTYYVYLSTNATSGLGNGGLKEVATFESYVPYTLGDVDGDEEFTATDALYTLQMAVGLGEWDDTQRLSANVDGDANITATDALWILQRAVGLRGTDWSLL